MGPELNKKPDEVEVKETKIKKDVEKDDELLDVKKQAEENLEKE